MMEPYLTFPGCFPVMGLIREFRLQAILGYSLPQSPFLLT